jgi:hypothetical protein
MRSQVAAAVPGLGAGRAEEPPVAVRMRAAAESEGAAERITRHYVRSAPGAKGERLNGASR